MDAADIVAGAVSPTGEPFVCSEVIHRSPDKGLSWRRPIPGMWISSFLSHPPELLWSNSGAMFMLIEQGIWRSTDNGNTWDSIFQTGVTDLAYDAEDGLLVASVNADVIISTNEGALWNYVTTPKEGENVEALFLDLDGIIYASIKGQLFRSTNMGTTWVEAAKLSYMLKSRQVCSPKKGVLLACVDGQVYRSLDSGIAWQSVYNESGGSIIAVSPDTLFLTTSLHLHRSTNSGMTWSVYSEYSERFTFLHPQILFGKGDDLYVIVADSLFRHNIRTADSWQHLRIPSGSPTKLATSKAGNIFATLNNTLESRKSPQLLIFESGAWQEIPEQNWAIPSANLLSTIGVDSADRICAVVGGSYVWSSDRGNTWAQSASARQGFEFKIAHSAESVFLISERQGFYRSTDYGVSFVNNHSLDTFITSIATSDSVVYAAGIQTYYRSTDEGNSWEEPIFPFILGSGEVRAISCEGPNVVFGVVGTGAYFSSDHGILWENHSEGLTSIITSLQLTPSSVVLAGTFDGVFEYSPITKTWKNVNDGVLDGTIMSLALGPDGRVYVATMGDGVYRTTKTYGSWISSVKQDVYSPDGVSIYPNPASSEVQIHFNADAPERYRITICDLLGEPVLVVHDVATIDVSTLRSGQYFLRIVSHDGIRTLPLTIVR